jgi:hypothetical protein
MTEQPPTDSDDQLQQQSPGTQLQVIVDSTDRLTTTLDIGQVVVNVRLIDSTGGGDGQILSTRICNLYRDGLVC